MLTTLNVIIAVLLLAIVGVLVAGLLSMRGGANQNQPGRLSNKLMRWRVALQFAAVMLIALTAWLTGKH